jgi:hypothetical protein
MEGGLAAVALDYCCAIDDMIEMSVGKKRASRSARWRKQNRSLWRVEKNSPSESVVEAIGIEDTAEAFEPIHEKNGQRDDAQV